MILLRELREAARQCSNIDYRYTLHEAASNLEYAIKDFSLDMDKESLIRVNGLWAKAEAVLKKTPPEGTPAPLSGSPEPARLAA